MAEDNSFGSTLDSRLLVLVFTDLAGSTALKEQRLHREASDLIKQHRRLVRQLLPASHGNELNTMGDGFLVSFEKAHRAVEFALRLQRSHRQDPGLPAVKVGIHQGQVEILSNPAPGKPSDVLGLAVDLAARICAGAHPGQILISRGTLQDARQFLGDKTPELGPLQWTNHGLFQLKGSQQPLQICEIGLDGWESPGPPKLTPASQPGESPGSALARYHILEKIGEGGMGEVFLAEDTSLGRRVALKVLPEALAADRQALGRFLREARSAGSLDHPYICHVHEAGEADGRHFIAMEYVPGETLRDRLKRGPIEPAEVIRIGREIAEALELAHSKGIIHRDLKPSNIMLTPQGHAKILDFGLAKQLPGVAVADDEQTATALTQVDSILGTPAYMSPEQLKGNALDARSDLFSFGIILAEMLTGIHPFRRSGALETSAAILNEEPRFPEDGLSGEAGLLKQLALRLLAKEPGARMQSVEDVGAALKEIASGGGETSSTFAFARPIRLKHLALMAGLVVLLIAGGWGIREWMGGRVSPGPLSIAVLPLTNLSGDPDQEYFADGMTEALITDLGKIAALRVIGRTSVMRFKGSTEPLADIARRLGVDLVVEGSTQRVGDEAGISIRVIQADTENQLWSQSYQRKLSNLLALQSEMARTVARQVKAVLTPEENERLSSERVVNPKAHEAYLKGMFHLKKYTPEGFAKAIEFFNEAIREDPDNALAYAAIAQAYNTIGHGPAPPRTESGEWPDYEKTLEALKKALELDDTLAEAHSNLGYLKLTYEWDLKGAEEAYRRTFELNPSLADAHLNYGWYLLFMGQTEAGLEEMRRAEELDPLTPLISTTLGWAAWWAGRLDLAAEQVKKAQEIDPNFPVANALLGDLYAEKGQYDEAIQAHQKARAVNPTFGWGLGYAYGLAGRSQEAREVLAEMEAAPRKNPWGIAEIYVSLGEKEKALDWLETAYKTHHTWAPFAGMNPPFAPLMDEPRMEELLRKFRVQ